MKTCKDCIHFDTCYIVEVSNDIADYCCSDFKDVSKFIEKPFNLRDKIYIITKYSHSSPHEIIECIVTKMSLKDGSTIIFSCYGLYANNNYYRSGNFKTSSIGKTVFLTREEAEKKLEELK